MLRLPLVISVLVLALTVGSSTTFAKGNGGKVDNVAATRAYLLARQRLMLAGKHGQQAGEAAVQSLVARVKTECSGVLAEAPKNRAREDIRDEIVEEVPLTLERPARNATLVFASTVQRLHWSNRKLTYYVTDLKAYKDNLRAIGTAYRDVFGHHYPATTLVEVRTLFHPDALVEIEAVAVCQP